MIETAANAGPIRIDGGDDDGAAAAAARLTAIAQQMIDKNVCKILIDNTK